MSNDEQSLIAAIVADPDNDGPRLILADWYTEREDVRAAPLRLSGMWRIVHGRTGENGELTPFLTWCNNSGESVFLAIIDSMLENSPVYCELQQRCKGNLAEVRYNLGWMCLNCFQYANHLNAHQSITCTTEMVWCHACSMLTDRKVGEGCCVSCHNAGYVRGRRGWTIVSEYDS